MTCVLGTHVVLWDVFAPEKLNEKARLDLDTHRLIIADITLCEIAMLAAKQRISLPVDVETFLQRYCEARSVDVHPVTPKIAAMSVSFGMQLNLDPADRLIVATACAEHCPLVTADKNLQQAGIVEVIEA